ncbi:endonuclease domain-containing protein [Streptomyces lasiicapitis]|uniref:endonuclease domain-containing protein n=1 Tax=Streptomyces lasiicapitis TaxID=1923961 RepID=UPI0036B420E8
MNGVVCTATTAIGRPCKAQASRWPRGVDGNPLLCGRHLPVPLREIRDAGFAELERRHDERLAAREPVCWSWGAAPSEGKDDRFAFRAWHDGRCAVCGYRDVRLVDDHDHDTGLIRGLLCRSCNGREPNDDGLFRKYRERPPAQILGIYLRYWDPFRGWAQPRVIDPNRLDNHPAYALAAKLAGRLQADSKE